MKKIIVTIAAAIAALTLGASVASANPEVPWAGGSCDAGDGQQLVMQRYQGTVFVCVPPGYWAKTGGIR
ncbi:hypothetical protein H7J77_16815 [Mycolicibacillus parakoreensis]|uniref:Secreted protein n=1 Tax=Mycolicibacillus parakoreensis TaxID=1069221 RepID=A0ABY3TXB0_9MYCO|nr:hypothetical protein [Mycolicibacillus parakoreensis]MCV7317198.1 hypothetical protein [Mycolicibacillus parakoreensis]ULN51514.1 hypothetical protein MIU77_11410 [Mycolicibacillus parakoreensis]